MKYSNLGLSHKFYTNIRLELFLIYKYRSFQISFENFTALPKNKVWNFTLSLLWTRQLSKPKATTKIFSKTIISAWGIINLELNPVLNEAAWRNIKLLLVTLYQVSLMNNYPDWQFCFVQT